VAPEAQEGGPLALIIFFRLLLVNDLDGNQIYDRDGVADGRFSGGSHGFVIGHVAPEAQEGGPMALVSSFLVYYW